MSETKQSLNTIIIGTLPKDAKTTRLVDFVKEDDLSNLRNAYINAIVKFSLENEPERLVEKAVLNAVPLLLKRLTNSTPQQLLEAILNLELGTGTKSEILGLVSFCAAFIRILYSGKVKT